MMMVPMGYEKCKGPLEDRFWEIKELLAQDFSINEIALKLEIEPGPIYGFLKKRGWEEMLQPGVRMVENRLRWATVAQTKANAGTIEPGRIQDVIRSFSTMVQRNMIRDGWIVDRDDIESAVGEAVTVAINSFDPAKDMAFTSYLHLKVSSRIIELQRRLYRDKSKVSVEHMSKDETALANAMFPNEITGSTPHDDTPYVQTADKQ